MAHQPGENADDRTDWQWVGDHRQVTPPAPGESVAGSILDRRRFLKTTAASAGVATLFADTAAADATGIERFDRRVPSFDGVEIASTVFLPADDGQYPVVMATHGYGGDRSSVVGFGEFFAKQGYVVITWDQRGFGESGGEVDSSGPRTTRDVEALIDFLIGENPASEARFTSQVFTSRGDPSVGMIGGSYAGGVQMNASAIDDRIDALFPIIPWYDLRFSLAPDDVPKQGWTTLLQAVGATGSRGLTSGDGQPERRDIENGVSPRLYEFYAEALALNEMSQTAESFFAVRSTVSKADEVTADALVVQGWPDTLFVPNEGQSLVRALNTNGNDNEAKLIFYNGGHTIDGNGGTKAFSITDTALQWFETKLKGNAARGASDAGFAPVTYYDVQAGAAANDSQLDDVSAADSPLFHETDSFPPTDATTVDLSLADVAGVGSTFIANSGAPTSTSQVAPTNEDAASGVTAVNFDFPVSGEAELATTPQLEVGLEPLGTRAFCFAKVYHVSDGESTLINNQVAPRAFQGTPGEAQTVDIEMVSFHRRFEKGDTLRLTLATTDAGFNSARQSEGIRIYHAASTLSVHALVGAANLEP